MVQSAYAARLHFVVSPSSRRDRRWIKGWRRRQSSLRIYARKCIGWQRRINQVSVLYYRSRYLYYAYATDLVTTAATMGTQSGATGFTLNNTTNGSPYITRTAATVGWHRRLVSTTERHQPYGQ